MWREIRLIGRDNLLKNQIRPRLRERKGFLLVGQHGIGKSALLEWVSDYAPGKVALISATWTMKEMLKEICQGWRIEVMNDDGEVITPSKWQVALMEQSIYSCDISSYWLLIDDIHQATPAVLRRLKILRERCLIVGAGVPPFKRQELRRIMWGLPTIDVRTLKKADMMRIGKAAAPIVGTRTPVQDAVHAARGIPGQLFHALRGEVTVDNTKTQGEEIDISPLLLLVVVAIMAFRYIGRGLDSPSLTMLGGLGMAGALIIRMFLFKGMSK